MATDFALCSFVFGLCWVIDVDEGQAGWVVLELRALLRLRSLCQFESDPHLCYRLIHDRVCLLIVRV